jgi:hypothetical protein
MRYTILHIYNVLEHNDMLSVGIHQQPCYTFYPHYLDQIVRFWVTCDDVIITSWLRLTGFPHPYSTYKLFEHIDIIDMLSIGIQQQPSYTVTIPILVLVGSDFGVLGHLWSQNDVNTSWSGVFAPPANKLGLSIKEKDLLFCTYIGRWPLPLPSYLCNPANALGLSIEAKDLLFCKCIGRWPLPPPSYLCNWPLNRRE